MKPIVDALMYDKQFEMPSQIQASTLPVILKGYNLIAQAQSGAGKYSYLFLKLNCTLRGLLC